MLLQLLQTTPTDAALDFGWVYTKMGLVLAIVIGLAYVFLHHVLPRLGFSKPNGVRGDIEIVSRQALDPKKQLWIVRVEGRKFLLGSADQSVTCLAELRSDESPEA